MTRKKREEQGTTAAESITGASTAAIRPEVMCARVAYSISDSFTKHETKESLFAECDNSGTALSALQPLALQNAKANIFWPASFAALPWHPDKRGRQDI